jgi:nicotinamide mononucleotide adenylyltransferase
VELQRLSIEENKLIKYSEGSAHGRFQPLHNEHLRYLLAAKKLCKFLWIGITQYDVYSLSFSPKDPHRQEYKNNPLTYFERLQMIKNAFLQNSVKNDEFAFIPFPIENPDSLPGFLPPSIPIFTTINDKWNEDKINILESKGYKVIILWEDRTKKINGITIRNLIRLGDESWKQMVPLATIDTIEKHNIRDRIINLDNYH